MSKIIDECSNGKKRQRNQYSPTQVSQRKKLHSKTDPFQSSEESNTSSESETDENHSAGSSPITTKGATIRQIQIANQLSPIIRKESKKQTESPSSRKMPASNPVTEDSFVKLFLEAMSHPEIGTIFATLMQPMITQLQEQTDKKLETMQEKINTQDKKIQDLEEMVDQLDQDSRMNKIVISGIKVEKFEQENIKNIANFMDVVMKINIPKQDILSAHRIGREGKAMLVTLASPLVKETIFKEKKNLKHQANMVYINENLTPRRSKLFKRARDLVKSKNISSAWTSRGNILVKGKNDDRPQLIKRENDLEKYLKMMVTLQPDQTKET